MERVEMELLGERIAEHAAHLDAAMHRLLGDLRRFDQGGGWFHQGARSCAQWLAWRVGWDLGTAREHVRVANKLADLPKVDDALRRGEVSYSKVRAITRVATVATEEILLGAAQTSTASQLETVCRKYATVLRQDTPVDPGEDQHRRRVIRRDLDDGMVRIEAILHPEEAAVVWAALDRAAKAQCRESTDKDGDHHCGDHHYGENDRDGDGNGYRDRDRNGDGDGDGNSYRDRYDCANEDGEDGEHGEAGEAGEVSRDVSAETRESMPAATLGLPNVSAETRESMRAATSGLPNVSAETNNSRSDAEMRSARRLPANGFDRADALVAIAQGYVRGARPHRTPVDIIVTVSEGVLRRHPACYGNAGHEPDSAISADPTDVACLADGTCLSTHAVRRLSCDAGRVELVEAANRTGLSIGRKSRSVPASLKRALLCRDGGRCQFPGCTNRVFLESHHIEHWANGGPTNLGNLLAVCSHHHRFLHEYGYTVELDAAGPRFFDDQGRRIHHAPGPKQVANLGWDTIHSLNEHLGLTAEVNQCSWDGGPTNYEWAIHDLVVADGLQ